MGGRKEGGRLAWAGGHTRPRGRGAATSCGWPGARARAARPVRAIEGANATGSHKGPASTSVFRRWLKRCRPAQMCRSLLRPASFAVFYLAKEVRVAHVQPRVGHRSDASFASATASSRRLRPQMMHIPTRQAKPEVYVKRAMSLVYFSVVDMHNFEDGGSARHNLANATSIKLRSRIEGWRERVANTQAQPGAARRPGGVEGGCVCEKRVRE